MQDHGSTVAVPCGAEVWREQGVDPELRITAETTFDRQHIASCVRGDAQAQRVALMLVDDFDGRDTGRQQPHPIIGNALDLGPETLVVSDDEAEVTDLRDVDARVIHLVDDAETQGKPQSRNAERTSHHVLGAARPSRRGPRPAGSVFDHRLAS
jgi:hypothetical protein